MKIALLSSLFILSGMAFGHAPIEEELFVLGNEPALIREISQHHDLIIDHVQSGGFEVYGPKGTARYLRGKGVQFYNLKHARKNIDWSSYPSYEQVTAKLQEFARKFPAIVQLTSVGKTGQNRDLWMLKISDNVAADETEPEFKYISSMHGDEITGRELTLRLVDEMLTKYGSDREITELINNTELFIMPSMNPDGSQLRQRANARGQDLNRNFPEAVRNDANTAGGRQPETQAIMAWQAQRNVALSANFHGGAVVANYPWDAKSERHPFDALLQAISLEYADLNPEMRSSREFSRGITNGADWYILQGGMQDWSYIWHNDLQITIELSDAKWPNYAQIPAFYRSNRDSMLRYMELVHQGAGVKFANKRATGTVVVKTAGGQALGSYGFQNGEFYKVLAPGDYVFEVRAGAVNKSVSVSVRANRVGAANYVGI